MAKAPKRPKMSKAPKRPKASASVTSWEKYHEKVKAVEKRNAEKVAEYNKKVNAIKKAKSKKLALIGKSVKIKTDYKLATL